MKVLLLDGHTIQVLPFLESLNKKRINVTLFCEEKWSCANFSLYKKKIVYCPKIRKDEKHFLEFLKAYLRVNPQDLIIPLFNDSAEFSSKYKEVLEEEGTRVEIPTWSTFIQGHNKENLMNLCIKLDIAHPRTINPQKYGTKQSFNYVGFPCLIKPNLSAGAKGLKILRNESDFDLYYDYIVNRFGESTIQEFIPQNGMQLKVQIYRSEFGEVIASSCYEKCRYYPIDGGTSTCNRVISRPDLIERYRKVLDYLDWHGIADFDCIEDPRNGEILLMEINPRVPGTIKASFLAGIDIAEIMICHSLRIPYKNYTYKSDFYMRNFAMECVWFVVSKQRFTSNPNWFNFFGRNIFYVDISMKDPFTFLGSFYGGLMKLLNPSFRKDKKK